jgi:hypothetical protein
MPTLIRQTKVNTATNVVITSLPSANEGVEIATLRAGSPQAPRFSFLAAFANSGTVALPAGTLILAKFALRWTIVAELFGGKAVSVTTTIPVEEFLQGIGNADRITLFHAAAPGAVNLEFGHYED